MKIYRLQDSEGTGPYYHYGFLEISELHNENLDKWPGVYDDIEDYDCDSDLSGCTSIRKLYQWFGKEAISRAKHMGFSIDCHEIDKCHVKFGVSGKQVAFDPKYTKRKYKYG
jgi:hypothetical protein